MSSSSTGIPHFYVDTCVISGFVNGDMRPEDQSAFARICDMVQDSAVTLSASTVVRGELDRIPEEYRTQHVEAYEQLRIVRASTNWLPEDEIGLGAARGPADSMLESLTSALPDEGDAHHLWHAARHGIAGFLTVDYRTVLSRTTQVESICGVRAQSPSQFVSSIQGST